MKAGSKLSVLIEAIQAIKPEYRQHLKILKSLGTPQAPLTPPVHSRGRGREEERRSHYPNYGRTLGQGRCLTFPLLRLKLKMCYLLLNWSMEIVTLKRRHSFCVIQLWFSVKPSSWVCAKSCVGFVGDQVRPILCKGAIRFTFMQFFFLNLCQCAQMFATVLACVWFCVQVCAIQCDYVWLCALVCNCVTVCAFVRLCVIFYDCVHLCAIVCAVVCVCVHLCAIVCDCVHLCVIVCAVVCDCVRLCALVCNCVHLCAIVCGFVCLCALV